MSPAHVPRASMPRSPEHRSAVSRRGMMVGTAAAAALGLAACESGADAADPETPLEMPAEDAELSGTIKVLTPSFSQPETQDVLDRTIETFTEKHPDATITIDHTDFDKLNEKITTGVAAGVIADIIMAGVGWTPPFAEKGIFQRIADDDIDALGMNPNILASAMYDGGYYSLPYSLDCRFMTARSETFSDNGITAPPATLTELADLSKDLTGGDQLGLDLGENMRQLWIHVLYAMGGTLFSEDGLETRFDHGAGGDALQWIIDRKNEGSWDFDLRGVPGQPTPFQQKKTMLALTGTSQWPNWEKMTPELTEPGAVETFLLPGADGQDPVMFLGGTLISISSRSKNLPLAAAFGMHMLEPELQVAYAGAQGATPPQTDIPDNKAVRENTLVQFALKNFDYAGAAEGGTPAWMSIRGNLDGMVEGALTGQKSIAETIKDMKEMADDAMGLLNA
jgi:multiple sugar transport system substrate-binding protein